LSQPGGRRPQQVSEWVQVAALGTAFIRWNLYQKFNLKNRKNILEGFDPKLERIKNKTDHYAPDENISVSGHWAVTSLAL